MVGKWTDWLEGNFQYLIKCFYQKVQVGMFSTLYQIQLHNFVCYAMKIMLNKRFIIQTI